MNVVQTTSQIPYVWWNIYAVAVYMLHISIENVRYVYLRKALCVCTVHLCYMLWFLRYDSNWIPPTSASGYIFCEIWKWLYAASNTGPFRERERESNGRSHICVRMRVRAYGHCCVPIGCMPSALACVSVFVCVCTGAADACAMCKGGCYTPAAVREGIFVSKWGIVMWLHRNAGSVVGLRMMLQFIVITFGRVTHAFGVCLPSQPL